MRPAETCQNHSTLSLEETGRRRRCAEVGPGAANGQMSTF